MNTPAEHAAIDDIFLSRSDVQRCPYARFDSLRSVAGLHYSKPIEAYVVARYADAVRVLGDPETFSSRVPFGRLAMRREREAIAAATAEDPELASLLERLKPRRIPMLASADDPAHRRQRRLVLHAFSGARINAVEPWIRSTADKLVDGFGTETRVDVVSRLAVPLPVRVIAHMLGVDDSLHTQFKLWSDDFIFSAAADDKSPADLKAALRGQKALFEFFAAQVAERERAPRDDLISGIVQAYKTEGEALDTDEIVAMAAQLMVGGNETTSGLITACLEVLAREPALAAALRADGSAIPRFVEETVRREGPAQGNFRVATRDAEIAGVQIRKGEQVFVLYNAASLDPQAFGAEPLDARFEMKGRHIGFGFREHACIGAPLARLEARIAVETMLRRYAGWSIAADQQYRYVKTYIGRVLLDLPLTLQPRS